jgi:hypothetical protein
MDTLAEIDRIIGRTRAALRSFWYPLVVSGALTLGAGALYAFAPSGLVGTYWLIGWAAVFAVVWRYYALRARTVGVTRNGRYAAALWLGTLVGATLAATLGAWVAASVLIALLYLVLARLQWSVLLAGIGVVIAAFGCAIAWADPTHVEAIWCFGVGVILTVTGLYARERDISE